MNFLKEKFTRQKKVPDRKSATHSNDGLFAGSSNGSTPRLASVFRQSVSGGPATANGAASLGENGSCHRPGPGGPHGASLTSSQSHQGAFSAYQSSNQAGGVSLQLPRSATVGNFGNSGASFTGNGGRRAVLLSSFRDEGEDQRAGLGENIGLTPRRTSEGGGGGVGGRSREKVEGDGRGRR